jgi:hypothetical protein
VWVLDALDGVESVSTSHHHSHHETRLRRFLRNYRFEVIWLAIVAVAVFLIFEPWHIRRWLSWQLTHIVSYARRFIEQLVGRIADFLAQAAFSDTIGFLLLLVALVMIAWRVRWRLLRNPAYTTVRCPKCDGTIHVIHRHTVDRLINLYVPVRRYRCANAECRWCGLRIGNGRGSGRASTSGRS